MIINILIVICTITTTTTTTSFTDTSTTTTTTPTTEADPTLVTRTVQGIIHKGLYTAAMGLLEGYNLRPVLMRLLNAGYQVKVVGHSLGAGIAALIAAELRISLISKHLEVYENPDSVRSSSRSSTSRGSFSMEQNLSHMDAPTTTSATTVPPATPINTKAGTTITLIHTYIFTLTLLLLLLLCTTTTTSIHTPTIPTTTITTTTITTTITTTTIPANITITTTSTPTPTILTAGTTTAAPSSPFPTTTNARPTSGLRVPSYLPTTVSKISAIIFSSPAFCTINLAEAFQHDRILINTVYDKDIIPRFSFKTIELMAEELKDPNFCTQADLWTQEDKADFSAYAVSMGKAADINRTSSTATATSNPETSNTAVPSTTTTTTTDAILTEVGAVPVQDTDAFTGKPPIKPVKPPKVDRASSVESFASYCTAEGEDSPLTPTQSRKIHEPIGIPAEGVGSSNSNSSSNDAQSQLDVGKPAATSTGATTTTATTAATTSTPTTTTTTAGSGSTKLSSFMQSVSSWQSLASTAIETLQSVNNNMGGECVALYTVLYIIYILYYADIIYTILYTVLCIVIYYIRYYIIQDNTVFAILLVVCMCI